MLYEGRTAVVTGAGGGIGRAIALELIDRGMTVHALDLTPPDHPTAGIVPHVVDVRDSAGLEKVFGTIEGEIELLVNNAGVMRRGRLFQTTEEEFDLLFGIHVKGSWLTLKHAMPALAKRATVVQMSSRHALSPPPDPAVYALAKQASLHLGEMVRRSCPDLRVKILCPGPIDTPLSRHGVTGKALEEKIGRMHAPEEFAGKVMDLIESDRFSLLRFDNDAWGYVFEE